MGDMKPLLRRLAAVALIASTTLLYAAEEKPKTADMARVAIVKYEDKTGTKNFEYMPGSLQEAIGSSMHKKFEFVEADLGKVEPIVAQVRAKNKGKIGPKEAAEICRLADIDILIYGDFTFNKDEQEIEIHTNISLGSTDKFRLIVPTENRVDATIFQAADKVATDIVAEITKVALEQQQAKGKTELDKKKKTQLEKTEKSTTWADINWNFSLTPGATYPLVSREKAQVKAEPAASVLAMYRLRSKWHVGLFASFNSLKSNSNTSPYQTNMDHLAGAATLGYYFDLSPRWRLTTMLGGGYYFGKLSVYNTCSSSNTSCYSSGGTSTNEQVKNPFFMARSGIHFLIFSFLSLGVEAEWRMLYDSKPVQSVGGALSLSVVF